MLDSGANAMNTRELLGGYVALAHVNPDPHSHHPHSDRETRDRHASAPQALTPRHPPWLPRVRSHKLPWSSPGLSNSKLQKTPHFNQPPTSSPDLSLKRHRSPHTSAPVSVPAGTGASTSIRLTPLHARSRSSVKSHGDARPIAFAFARASAFMIGGSPIPSVRALRCLSLPRWHSCPCWACADDMDNSDKTGETDETDEAPGCFSRCVVSARNFRACVRTFASTSASAPAHGHTCLSSLPLHTLCDRQWNASSRARAPSSRLRTHSASF